MCAMFDCCAGVLIDGLAQPTARFSLHVCFCVCLCVCVCVCVCNPLRTAALTHVTSESDTVRGRQGRMGGTGRGSEGGRKGWEEWGGGGREEGRGMVSGKRVARCVIHHKRAITRSYWPSRRLPSFTHMQKQSLTPPPKKKITHTQTHETRR
jgi:hypothetical protein